VKRLLVALAVLAVVALLALLLWPDDEESGRAAAPLPVAPARDLPEPPAETQPVARAEALPRTRHEAVAQPVVPVPSGVLTCEVTSADDGSLGSGCTLRVLLPTGGELASRLVSVPGTAQFTGLPTRVPLVVAVSARECLSGLCCDVLLASDLPSVKRIALIRAPTVEVELTSAGRWTDARGLRVELLSGEVVVGEGVVGGGDTARIELQTFGEFRARVSRDGQQLVAGAPVIVQPTAEVQRCTVDLPESGSVEIQVLAASGAPARGVPVWLLGEVPQRPPVTTNDEGVVVFRGVPRGMKLSAMARDNRNGFASAIVTTDEPTQARVPLLLGEPATLTGDVVDQGNAAIRGASVEVTVLPGPFSVRVQSDDAGLFATPPLPGGLAEVLVRCDGYVDWRAPQSVEIRPGVGARIRARMTPRPTGTVFVRVRDESGAPVADAEVTADPARARTTTDASGACRFDGLEAGSEQTFYARRRGYRSRAGALPSVRVPRDTGAGADIVLRAAKAEPLEAGPVTASGVVLDPAGEPVFAARVTAGATVAYTDAAGSFRLTALAATAAEPVDLRIAPPPSMLETLRVLLDPDESGLAELGTVRLRARPYAVLEIPPAERALTGVRWLASPPGSSRLFWLSSNHADTLLGRRTNAFVPFPCVSYDGAWMHLPPADDWLFDGRGEVFVGFASPRGLFTTTRVWTLAPDAAPRLALPRPPNGGRLPLSGVKYGREKIVFRQSECATLFDPRSIHVPTGDPQPPVDPFAPLVAWRTFSVDARDAREFASQAAPGQWRVTSDGADTLIDVGADADGVVKESSRKKPGK
jgi:hypothetical protein